MIAGSATIFHRLFSVKPGTDINALNNKIKNITRIILKMKMYGRIFFFLNQWHLYSKFENGKPAGGRIETVRYLELSLDSILLIACINFMNLATAKSEKRAKEVGIRKVAGAGKALLVRQFIMESFVLSFVSGMIALLLVQLALPWFNTLLTSPLSIPYNSFAFWIYSIAFVVFTSLLAGSYPAFYLASFKPAGIFRGSFKKVNAVFSPRKVLVVLQFTSLSF
jgi:predicted lysophospholipase L1 biosynthesis ABC-type transport system permease subunit